MPIIIADKKEIKELIKESVEEVIIEIMKPKDENMLELIEDIYFAMIIEEDKK